MAEPRGVDQYAALPRAYAESKTLPFRLVVETPSLFAALGDHLAGARVLDLGCGSGHFARSLLARGAREVVGVDLSEAMVALARSTHAGEPRCRFLVGDAMQPAELRALGLGTFDAVAGIYLLNYARDETELKAMVESIAEHMKPWGVFVGLNDAVREDLVSRRLAPLSYPSPPPNDLQLTPTSSCDPAAAGAPQPYRFSREVDRAALQIAEGASAAATEASAAAASATPPGGAPPPPPRAVAPVRIAIKMFEADGITELVRFDNFLLPLAAYEAAFRARGLALVAPPLSLDAAAAAGSPSRAADGDWDRFLAAPPIIALVAQRAAATRSSSSSSSSAIASSGSLTAAAAEAAAVADAAVAEAGGGAGAAAAAASGSGAVV